MTMMTPEIIMMMMTIMMTMTRMTMIRRMVLRCAGGCHGVGQGCAALATRQKEVKGTSS